MVERYNPLAGLQDADGVRIPRRPPPSEIKLELVPDAIALLSSVRRPLAVLSICGPFRSGKSYFLSRLLGDEFFEVGHGLKACTIGLWMSTAILEGKDYSVLLVDTQGVDSISAAESVGSSLMAVTALLSSYLIYNSRRVPNNVDIEKLRICCLLSSTVLFRVTKTEISEVDKKFFPHFLWLLRDCDLKMEDDNKKPLDPTTYMCSCILKMDNDGGSQKGKSEAGKQVGSFFRSLECRKLPKPSTTPKVLRDMFGQKDRLGKEFTSEMSKTFDLILENTDPKVAMDGIAVVDGLFLAELVGNSVHAVNAGGLPDFRQGWMAQVRVRCQEIVDQMVTTYKDRMEQYLCTGVMPVEEENVVEKHKLLVEKSRIELKTSLSEIDPLSVTVDHSKIIESLNDSLEKRDGDGQLVEGCALHYFILKNYSASKENCEALWATLMKDCKIYEKVSQAVRASVPYDLTPDVKKLEEKFLTYAIGPAKEEVLEKSQVEIAWQSAEMLSKLPGMPQNFEVIGASNSKIKLSWDPPRVNPSAVVTYRVQMRLDGGEWETAKETSQTKALITDLVDSAKYEFTVVAIGEDLHGQEVSESAKTKVSGTREFVVNLASGAFPVIAAVNYFLHERQRGREVNWAKAAAAVALTTAVTPATVVGFPFSGPLLAMSLAQDDQLEELSKSWGDLSPEDD